MMNKQAVVNSILPPQEERTANLDQTRTGAAYAPSNIALIKYWGKRETTLNLPMTDSLSLSLGEYGAHCQITFGPPGKEDAYEFNQSPIDCRSDFYLKLNDFLSLFKVDSDVCYQVKSTSNLPLAAGLASSACGFAAVVSALNALHGWELSARELSLLARLGSGSACRSLWHGLVYWRAGQRDDGLDSHAQPLKVHWPELCIGLLLLSEHPKKISSRDAMQHTVTTSPLYPSWPKIVKDDINTLMQSIEDKDFISLGSVAEANALAMHATMQSARPPIVYLQPDTLSLMHQIWALRQTGLNLFFTQDAGPNLKLLFLKKDQMEIKNHFPELIIIEPFAPQHLSDPHDKLN